MTEEYFTMSKDKSTFSSFEEDQELFNNWREFLQKKPDHLLNEQKTGTTKMDPEKGSGTTDTKVSDVPPPQKTRPLATTGPTTGAERAKQVKTGPVPGGVSDKLADLEKQHTAGNIPTAKYKRIKKDLGDQGRMQLRPKTDITKFKPGIERRLPPRGYKPKPGTRPPSEKGKTVLTDTYGIEWNMDDHGYTTGKSPLPDPKTAKKAGLIDANDRLTKQGRLEVDKWQRAQRPKPEFKPKPGSIKLREYPPQTAAEAAVEAAESAAEKAVEAVPETSPAMKRHRDKMRRLRKAGPPTKVPGAKRRTIPVKKKRKKQPLTPPKRRPLSLPENVDKATRANEGLDLNSIIQEVYKRLTK